MRNIIAALALVALASPATAQETVRKDRTKAEVATCLVSFGYAENTDWVNVRPDGDKWLVDSRSGLKAKPAASPPVAGDPTWAQAVGLCLHGTPKS